jgi:hypothetical protein
VTSRRLARVAKAARTSSSEEGEAGGPLAESVGGEEQAPIDDPGLQVGGPVTIYAEIDKEGATIVWRYFFLIQLPICRSA